MATKLRNVKIELEIDKKLQDQAKIENRTISGMIKHMIITYLKNLIKKEL